MLHGRGLVPGYAGVVPVVHEGQVGDAQGAREVDVVDGHPQARWDGPAVLLPGDRDGQVPGHHDARDEDPLSNGKSRELERLDERRNWKKRRNDGDRGKVPTSRANTPRPPFLQPLLATPNEEQWPPRLVNVNRRKVWGRAPLFEFSHHS